MLPFTRADLEKLFPATTWSKGERLFDEQAVVEVEVERDGRSISGKVKSDRRVPCLTRVNVVNGRGGRVKLSSTCTCIVYSECEHAAALLIAALDKTASPEPEDATIALDGEVDAWMSAIGVAVRGGTDGEGDCLLYLLEPAQRSWRDGGVAQPVCVRTVRARRLRDGSYGRDNPVAIAQLGVDDPPRFLTLEDQVIGRMLAGAQGNLRRLHSFADGETLRMILATGRCHWQSPSNPPLQLGEQRSGRLHWQFDGEGQQRMLCSVDGEGPDVVVLNLGRPWYLDLREGLCGPVETGVADRPLRVLLSAPAIPAAVASLVRQRLAQINHGLPLPEPLRKRERLEVAPQPVLFLHCPRITVERGLGWKKETEEVDLPLARLSFDYAGAQVGWQESRSELNHVQDNRLLVIPRDALAEVQAVERLNQLGMQPLGPTGLGRFADERSRQDFTFEEDEDDDTSLRWVQFNHLDLPRLERDGWRILFDPAYPYRVAEVVDGWTLDVLETGTDWFEFELGVDIDGHRVALLPLILDLFERAPEAMSPQALEEAGDEPIYATLPDGRLLPLPAERLAVIMRALYEVLAARKVDGKGRVRLGRAEATRLVEIEEELPQGTIAWNGGAALRSMAKALSAQGDLPPVPVPKAIRASLRDYQKSGLSWLQFLANHQLSGILADDMGLGKTLQTLAHIVALKEAGRLTRPCLIVAPTSLIPTWRSEVRKFAPDLRLLVLHGQTRHELFEQIPEHDLVLTSYALLLRDDEDLGAHDWTLVVLDEAQAIKNPSTKLARAAYGLKADTRVCLTGTPIENHLGELWSIFHFLMPGLLGDRETFRRVFRNQIEKEGDAERQGLLAARVRPFLLRRTKEEVASELPPKTEVVREIDLTDLQRDLYESVRLAMHERVREEIRARGLAQSNIAILEALLKLRQVCCDPRLLKNGALNGYAVNGHKGESGRGIDLSAVSAKLDVLTTMLPGMIESGRRVILFSQFVEMLELIEQSLEELAIPFVKLTGRTRDRETPVKQFQAGEAPVFLISLKAGGTGLTLTRADTVIHYDPWWNPAVEAQATDRAHRIGQDKNVFVYKLISSGTVEERMVQLQARKKALVDGVLQGSGRGFSFTEQDIDALFAPLPE